MLYGANAKAYRDALAALETARVALHHLVRHVNGAYHNLETCCAETAAGVQEVQAILDDQARGEDRDG